MSSRVIFGRPHQPAGTDSFLLCEYFHNLLNLNTLYPLLQRPRRTHPATLLLRTLATRFLLQLIQLRSRRRTYRTGHQLELQLIVLLEGDDHPLERRIFGGIVTLDQDIHLLTLEGAYGSPDPIDQFVVG